MILPISAVSKVNIDNYLCEKWFSFLTLNEYSLKTLFQSYHFAHAHGAS